MTHPTLDQTYYAATANPQPERPALQGDIQADVCIIGAGFTGVSAGLHLAEAGLKVVILEAKRIGFGATGRNGGQIVNSYSRDIDVVMKQTSGKHAEHLVQMAFEGNRIIRERIEKYDIQCGLQNGGVFAAFNAKQMRHLESQQKLWAWHGYDKVEMLDKTALKKIVNTDVYVGGSIDHGAGHMHSLNLVLGQVSAMEQLGGVVYEDSAAIRIERSANPIVYTAQGQVTCKNLIIAGNAYLGGLVPELQAKSMPCGSQVICTEPLTDEQIAQLIPNGECIEDCNYLLDYYRITKEKRMIFGGGVIYGARDPKDVVALVRPHLLKTFPQMASVKIDYAWTGNFLMTLSRLPQMGQLSDSIYYSQGCSGHGITFTHVAGRVLSEAILGQKERMEAFASLPHYPFPGGDKLRVPLTAMGAMYYDMRDRFKL